jgi:hypothetical protein
MGLIDAVREAFARVSPRAKGAARQQPLSFSTASNWHIAAPLQSQSSTYVVTPTAWHKTAAARQKIADVAYWSTAGIRRHAKRSFWTAVGTWPISVGSMDLQTLRNYEQKHDIPKDLLFFTSFGVGAAESIAIPYLAAHYGGLFGKLAGAGYAWGNIETNVLRYSIYKVTGKPVPSLQPASVWAPLAAITALARKNEKLAKPFVKAYHAVVLDPYHKARSAVIGATLKTYDDAVEWLREQRREDRYARTGTFREYPYTVRALS